MAEIKKTTEVTAKAAPEVKPVAATTANVPEKAVEVKAEKSAPAKKETKAATKKTTTKKAATTKKATTKKADTDAKPATKRTAKKAVKQVINLQFAGKSYSIEDLEKIAGDVWKYDLHKADEEYTSLELYVKPEESVAYYVFNGDITGSFFI